MKADHTKKTRWKSIQLSVRILTIPILLMGVMLSTGCISASISQSVQGWNAWSDLQQKFSRQVDTDLRTLDRHHRTLNAGIVTGKPEFASLRQDLATDRQRLDLWKPSLTELDTAASRFFSSTSILNGTARETAQRMNRNIDIYLLNMDAAGRELVAYCTNLDAYLSEGDLAFADDSRRLAADAARERAVLHLQHADDALTALDTDARLLGKSQSVI